MPRPKRARRAPAKAVAATVTAPEETSSPAPASGSEIYSHSDREHSVIRKELEQGVAGQSSLFEESVDSRPHRSSTLRQRQVLYDAGRARDQAMSRLTDEIDATSSKGKASEERQKSDSSVEQSRKTRATPVQQRTDTTGLDLDDEIFDGLDTTIGDDDVPPSAARSDTSNFSVSHFRRRGRAPSISINKDDAPIRPSSRGVGGTPGISSTFNIGHFKRRQREPSILGTAQKERAQRPIELSSESESGDEDQEDFEPEAESTPLNRRRTQPVPASEPESESQQVLAPDSQPQKAGEPTSSVNSRKRKSIESHEDDSRPGKATRIEHEPEPEPEPEAEPEAAPGLEDDDSDSELSDLPSPVLTPTRPSAIPRPVTPNRDEIMAPPESSDSEDQNEAWPDIRTLARQRRRRVSPITPNRDGNISDASSPPSLTHSPNFPATRNKSRQKKQAKSPKVTTADLTGLLPRRRQKKARDPYGMGDSDEEEEEEVDASTLAQDDDELSHINARTRSRRTKAAPLNRSTANRPPSRGARGTATTAKAKETAANNRASRTYSRRLSDKENEAEGEAEAEAGAGAEGDSFAPVQDDAFESQESTDPIRSADELKQAARKFKEVDRWELEFEEVTEGSSPQPDAR
ncbi:hypothetical protein CCHL11_03419 [Colletotrichum chlorophyti]|uniref:Uncharacterized protein n=1 Tax=Colletotrichum chlorophyti TaxID=708187 RepID=A0A1Q8S080_9PEZI|nr:hypothetical protein CCHL11_03419 [Colletotrichum chlorophyti]